MKWFERREFTCKCGCNFNTVDFELAEVLDDLREYFNKPTKINSGNRCYTYNKSIGGAIKSQHLYGKAADIVVKDIHADDVADYLETKYPTKYGIGRYNGRTHIDVRQTKARWDKR